MRLGVRKVLQLSTVAGLLGVLSACLEGFERLETRVVYDPYEQSFAVERRLVGVAPSFLGCADVDGCVEAIGRSLALTPGGTTAMSDRLLQRLLESGAQDVRISLERVGDRLDARITYRARVGTGAADDTMVHAEWDGKRDRGRYYLVVTAQDTMPPPKHYRTRKVARGAAGATDWMEEWVLRPRQLEVETALEIGRVDPLFERVPGLADALAGNGWLGDGPPAATIVATSARAPASSLPPTAPAPVAEVVPEPVAEPVAEPVDEAVAEPLPEPIPAPASPPPPPAPVAPPSPEPSEDSPARTYVYDVQVSGSGLSPAAATQSVAPLVSRIARCYQDRHAEDPAVAGSVFLDAQVRADGFVVSTSIYGQLTDTPLLACLQGVLDLWRFPAWGTGDAVTGVALPLVFRVEAPPPAKKRRK